VIEPADAYFRAGIMATGSVKHAPDVDHRSLGRKIPILARSAKWDRYNKCDNATIANNTRQRRGLDVSSKDKVTVVSKYQQATTRSQKLFP
jgi:hypothetical protein